VTLDALRALLRAAEAAGVPPHILRAAAGEIVELLDAPAPDCRRVELRRRARAIQRLRAQGLARAAICARLGITPSAFQRAREHRASDAPVAENGRQSLKETAVDLKTSSIGLGTTPASLPKISNPTPSPPPLDTPRDGAGGAESGAEAAIAAQQENAK
jgi:hypothetical protein